MQPATSMYNMPSKAEKPLIEELREQADRFNTRVLPERIRAIITRVRDATFKGRRAIAYTLENENLASDCKLAIEAQGFSVTYAVDDPLTIIVRW